MTTVVMVTAMVGGDGDIVKVMTVLMVMMIQQ